MRRPDQVRRAVRGCAEVLLTLGVLVALYAVYELYGTGLATHRAQEAAAARLDRAWSAPPPAVAVEPPLPRVGDPVARIRIPALGPEWSYTVLEGTEQDVLADGPGHYTGTALPGMPGNVAVAGHRVGRGAPFDALDRLDSCDAIRLETRDQVLTYRVLPMAGEVDTWATTAAGRPECAGVGPLPGPYDAVTGRQIVVPTRTDVIATVPGDPAAEPVDPARLLTLTTCHPRFSARERLIVHAVLTDAVPKTSTVRAP